MTQVVLQMITDTVSALKINVPGHDQVQVHKPLAARLPRTKFVQTYHLLTVLNDTRFDNKRYALLVIRPG
jgi:hypothetical protein